jgi:hypothetical protein
MRDIYSKAKSVMLWMGEEIESILAAVTFLKRMALGENVTKLGAMVGMSGISV